MARIKHASDSVADVMVREARLRGAEESGRSAANEYAFLVSRAGRIIVHPKEELMLRKGYPGAELASRPGGQFIAAKPEGSAATIMDGEPRHLYWATSPLTGWKIVLNVSDSSIFAPLRQLALHSALIGMAGLVLMVVIVSRIARRLTHPLLDLTGAAAAIEQGNFREETLADLPQRRDELGELARSFRKMAREIRSREQSLAELNQNLEQTVEERTAELSVAKEKAEDATKAKSDFLANMSH
jgi:methyl-accepting chemotaxis protein